MPRGRLLIRLGMFLGMLLWTLPGCGGETVIIETSKLQDTYDRLGPYAVLTEVSDPDGVDDVTLHYSAGSLGEIVIVMDEVRRGIFEGQIPGQPPSTAIAYFVMAKDDDVAVTDPKQALTPLGERYRFRVLAQKCATDIDCGPGELCDASKVCRQHVGPCKTDAECGKGMRCGPNGACRLDARSCKQDEQCLVGEVCDLILGECMPRPPCGAEDSCPLDFACRKETGFCYRSCMGDLDCGAAETCDKGICSGAKLCKKQEDCASSLMCDPAGYCRPEGGAPCAICKTDVDCGGPTDFCLLLKDGLRCGKDCSKDACPEGYSCKKDTVPPQCVPVSGACQ